MTHARVTQLPASQTTPAGPWCQRWQNGQHAFRHTSEGGFDASRYQVIPLEERVARPFVERHHYARSFPAARMSFGLVCDTDNEHDTALLGGALVGVAVLGVPMSRGVLTNVFPSLEPYSEALELSRFVLLDGDDAPANSESYFLSRVFRLAAERGLRGVVSFSDPVPRWRTCDDGTRELLSPGHCGAIYQAVNGVALGRSTARTLRMVDGEVLSERTLSKLRTGEVGSDGAARRLVARGARPMVAGQDPKGWLRDALNQVGAVAVRHPGNFRYAWAVGSPAQRRRVTISGERTGYPKADQLLAA